MTKQKSDSINLSGTSKYDYNDWFTFFQKINADLLINSVEELQTRLPSDGYAALRRWLDIFDNPSKMEKISKAKMDEDRETDLIALAVGNDDEAYYVGVIRELAKQLNGSGTSPQEFARLSANMNVARKELREIRSRYTKKGTPLEKILSSLTAGDKKSGKTIASTTKNPKSTSVKKKAAARKPASATKNKKPNSKSAKAKK